MWGSKIQNSPPTVAYSDIMASDDHGLYKWLLNIARICNTLLYSSSPNYLIKHKFGFSFVSSVPSTPEATEELCNRIGFIRETQCSL